MNHEKIYTERIEVQFSKSQKNKMKKRADLLNLTLSQFIRNVIEDYLK